MTGVSTLGQALARIEQFKNQNLLLNSLANQLATGKKTQVFSGLQTDILTSKRARADFKSLDTYVNNIDNADRRIKLMLLTIEEFKAQAESFARTLVNLSQESVHQDGQIVYYDDPLTPDVNEAVEVGMSESGPDIDLTTVRDLATNLYDFMADLLNTQETNRYLLGGADTLTQPFTNNGTLDAAVSTLIGNWKDETLPAGANLTNTELISALRSRTVADDPFALTDSIVGYSAALSAGNVGNVFVRVNEKSEINYTALANDQPFRDIMVGLAFVKNADLTPIADTYAEPYTLGDPTLADGAPGATLDEMRENFFEVFNAITTMVNQAIDDIDSIRFRLEGVRARIDSIKQDHAEQKNALLSTISNVEDADSTEVAVKISALQLQLDASYRVTASTQQLSLVNFLSPF